MNRDGGLRQLFRLHLPMVDWQSIESPLTGLGIPDSNGCLDSIEFWIEYKQTHAYSVVIRPEQIAWGIRRERHGGRVWIAVRRKCDAGIRRLAVDELWLVPTSLGLTLSRGGLKVLQDNARVFDWTGGPSKWNWNEVLQVLTGRHFSQNK